MALRESEERLALAADSAEAGLWALDRGTGTFWVSDRCRTIMGFDPDTVVTMERLRDWVHPDDWHIVTGAIEEGVRTNLSVSVEFRIIVPGENRVRWILSRGRTALSAPGEGVHGTGVLTDITERKRAEEALRAHLRFETLLAELSSRLINLGPADVDREVSDALRRVCHDLGIDLAVLWQWSATSRGLITPTHSYPPLEDLQAAQPLLQERYPWVVRRMLDGEVVLFSRLDELPEQAALDRASARAAGIKSSITLPLGVGGTSPVGALAFSALREERDWPDPVVKRLQLIAEVLTNALARRNHELTLRESEADHRATFEQAAVGIAHVGFDGRFLRVNDKLCSILGYPREELLHLAFQEITHADDLVTDLQHVQQVLSGQVKTYAMEKRYCGRTAPSCGPTSPSRWRGTRAGDRRTSSRSSRTSSDRKRHEEALRLSETRLAAGADLAGLAFYEVHFDHGAIYVDERLRQICGVPADVHKGLDVLELAGAPASRGPRACAGTAAADAHRRD